MKKNILFVMPSLDAGGGEKSLVNLLSQIDFDLYNVDLFLFSHQGIFKQYLPSQVNVISLPESYIDFSLPFQKSIIKFSKKGDLSLLYNRIIFAVKNKIGKNIAVKEQKSWKHISSSLKKIEKNYDVAIGFLEKTSTYFCVDKVEAKKKIGWVHIDYNNLGMNSDFDKKYFKSLDNIVTVSEECANILAKKFPEERKKIEVIYNIVSPKIIKQMADQTDEEINVKKDNEVIIVSIGRLHYQKGFEMAIEACKQLVDKGYNVKWNVIGEGKDRGKLNKLIKEYKLENHFKLLGLKANPYPYIKEADIYVQPSRFEGKSIAIDEAKILQKSIVVTNFNTAKDQIVNNINGMVVDINSDAVAEGIEKLIIDVNFRNKLAENLAFEELGTEAEINKLYKMF